MAGTVVTHPRRPHCQGIMHFSRWALAHGFLRCTMAGNRGLAPCGWVGKVDMVTGTFASTLHCSQRQATVLNLPGSSARIFTPCDLSMCDVHERPHAASSTVFPGVRRTPDATHSIHGFISRQRGAPLSAVLRISGDRLDLADALADCSLAFTEAGACLRERRLDPDGHHPETTYNLTVSDADGGCVPQQIRDVEKFLDRNAQIIVAVKQSVAGCTSVMDFAWDFPRGSFGQYNRFPSRLLAKLAELQMDLEVSVYGTD